MAHSGQAGGVPASEEPSPDEPLRGKLLLAAPALIDPNFRRTVVLVVEHGEEGAMGIVLNRPTQATVAEAVPALAAVLGPDQPVFHGGPVAPDGVVVLAEFEDPERAASPIAPGVGFVGSEEDVDALGGSVRRGRAYAGHAGWGPGQLEAELEDDGWIVASREPEDLFADTASELWSAVLERMGGSYALIARMPADPSMN